MAAGSLRRLEAEAPGGAEPERLSPEAREDLRAVARLALEHAVRLGREPRIDLAALPPALHAPRASFVTLEHEGSLRGCIGSLEACEPLAVDVAANAVKAARDPRLPPVTEAELPALRVKIAVLSPLVSVSAANETELLAALRPGRDGLLLREGERSATFLPSVWSNLPEAPAFLRALRRKAALPEEGWTSATGCWRYTVEEID